MSVQNRTSTVCVVGAGSSGLAAAKNLLDVGIDVNVFERENSLGGNWNYGKPCSRVYQSTHTISSKRCTQYTGFSMPRHFPEYPHHSQILQYLQAYAERFGLNRVIEYETPVEKIEPFADGQAWDVSLGSGEVRRYGAVIIANGHNWSPKWPTYPGEFKGEVIHSASYKTPDLMHGKRVLIVARGIPVATWPSKLPRMRAGRSTAPAAAIITCPSFFWVGPRTASATRCTGSICRWPSAAGWPSFS